MSYSDPFHVSMTAPETVLLPEGIYTFRVTAVDLRPKTDPVTHQAVNRAIVTLTVHTTEGAAEVPVWLNFSSGEKNDINRIYAFFSSTGFVNEEGRVDEHISSTVGAIGRAKIGTAEYRGEKSNRVFLFLAYDPMELGPFRRPVLQENAQADETVPVQKEEQIVMNGMTFRKVIGADGKEQFVLVPAPEGPGFTRFETPEDCPF